MLFSENAISMKPSDVFYTKLRQAYMTMKLHNQVHIQVTIIKMMHDGSIFYTTQRLFDNFQDDFYNATTYMSTKILDASPPLEKETSKITLEIEK